MTGRTVSGPVRSCLLYTSSLVRYQYLWNELLTTPVFDVMDAVHHYGFSDQSHLLHEFKKYHTMLPEEARKYALGQYAPGN